MCCTAQLSQQSDQPSFRGQRDPDIVDAFREIGMRVVAHRSQCAALGIREGEATESMMVRFRTLGCQLCTGAVRSEATTLEQIIAETALATNSERENRAVDQDREGSMEEKKREGYF